jgi:putative ABC transport system permease protein
MLRPDWCRYLIARLKPSSDGIGEGIQGAMEHMNSLWDEYVKDSDFAYTFLDERIEREYQSEKQIRQIARSFSLLAIIISSLGLFGLALFMAETRTKEIGIRKVNGASDRKVMFLLTMDFTKWVLVSMVIAIPVSWLAMSEWLQNFPYRIQVSADLFILAGVIAIAISWVTVAYHAWITASKNPVNSLRYE